MAGHGALALALFLALAVLAAQRTASAVPSAAGGLAAMPGFQGLNNYVEDGEENSAGSAGSAGLDDYSDNDLTRYPAKRSCVRRGGNCDHRPGDCCYNSSCRCNLWGANCRCQRMGLFQKWGKK